MLEVKSKSIFVFRAFPALPAVCAPLLMLLLSCASAQDPPSETAETELKQGKYSAAIVSYNRLLQANPNDGAAQRGLLKAYLETGQYAEAERDAKKFAGSKGNEAQSQLMLGEVFAVTGRYDAAIKEFEKAGKSEDAAIKLRADLRRGEILELTGKEEAARVIFQSFVNYYKEEDPDTSEELMLIAKALVHLERYKEANDIYLEAIAADPEDIEAHLGGGELYTTKYNYAEAAEFLADALKINPNSARAHLDIALNKRIDGGDQMNAALAQALKINPNYVDAKNFAATLDIEAEKYGSAASQLEEALKINSNSLEARSLRAAMFWLQNKQSDFDNEVKSVLAINPRYGMLYEILAHFATQTRRYDEAVAYLREGLKLSPNLWSSHLALGIGLLRQGKMEEGRAEMEVAFKGDPFNIWAKNTLDLLDAMKDFRETKSGDFILRTAAKETDVLIPYASGLLEEAQSKLAAKYQFKPRGPISVEIFPNHADFEVRVLGLTGLGALGVCFGQLIAQDSPSARPIGQFNWGSTLWHEYTHVVTLQITNHLIPRWFSEGLSVYEEHNARPGWGDDWTAEHLKSFVDGRWFKISEIDNGFIRPKRPDDVPLAYFEASQICHFIADKYGFDAILQMLRGYRDKKKTPEILQQVLKLSETDFDREFNNYLKGKVDQYIKNLDPAWKNRTVAQLSKEEVIKQAEVQKDDFSLNIRAGFAALADGKEDQAAVFLKRSIELFPYQSGPGNAYEPLAGIQEKKGDKTAAADTLAALVKVDENNYNALKKLAQLKFEAGDKSKALEYLGMSFYVNPFEHSAHTLAGNQYLERGESGPALREYLLALAANPPNIAEAQYNLARAYLVAGKPAEAKRAVLRSLEAAPSFDKAQELLLKLTGQ